MPSKTHYGVLGIDYTASSDEIRKAYRKRALETHPDKLDPNSTEAEKQDTEKEFHKVHEAFEILGDPVKRKIYDTRLRGATDPNLISDEAHRRIDARKEWAQRQREEHDKRMSEHKAKIERERQAQEAAALKKAKESALFVEMLNDIYKLNPEFAARREAALQRKAERERADMMKRTQSAPSVFSS